MGNTIESSKVLGCRALTKVHVQAEIQRLQTIEAEKADVTPETVIKELKSIAFADTTEDSVIKPQHKLAALDMLSKHLGLYERDNLQKSLTLVEIMAIAAGNRAELPLMGDKPLLEVKADV